MQSSLLRLREPPQGECSAAVSLPTQTPVASRDTEARVTERLWSPSAERIERAGITRYLRWLEAERGLRFDDYEALH